MRRPKHRCGPVPCDDPKMSKDAMLRRLLDEHGWHCWGCDEAFEDIRYYHLDHKTPWIENGIDCISNRAPLCEHCNLLKRDHYTMRGLQRENRRLGRRKREAKLIQWKVHTRKRYWPPSRNSRASPTARSV